MFMRLENYVLFIWNCSNATTSSKGTSCELAILLQLCVPDIKLMLGKRQQLAPINHLSYAEQWEKLKPSALQLNSWKDFLCQSSYKT
jgi:hypothetical protein